MAEYESTNVNIRPHISSSYASISRLLVPFWETRICSGLSLQRVSPRNQARSYTDGAVDTGAWAFWSRFTDVLQLEVRRGVKGPAGLALVDSADGSLSLL